MTARWSLGTSSQGRYLFWWCPGCRGPHGVPTEGPKGWALSWERELPTLAPSILVHEHRREEGALIQPRCHSFLRAGRLEYLGDCGHSLAGQTVELPPWSTWD